MTKYSNEQSLAAIQAVKAGEVSIKIIAEQNQF
jgi:transposase-like protein